jgi:membrane protein YqaA with SNARE-associated domain
MAHRTTKGSLLGSIAGWCLSVFSKRPAEPSVDDLKRAEFKTSTQRFGLRFTDRIRDIFRLRWLRRH